MQMFLITDWGVGATTTDWSGSWILTSLVLLIFNFGYFSLGSMPPEAPLMALVILRLVDLMNLIFLVWDIYLKGVDLSFRILSLGAEIERVEDSLKLIVVLLEWSNMLKLLL